MIKRRLFKYLSVAGLVIFFLESCNQPAWISPTSENSPSPAAEPNQKQEDICQIISTKYPEPNKVFPQSDLSTKSSEIKKSLEELTTIINDNRFSKSSQAQSKIKVINESSNKMNQLIMLLEQQPRTSEVNKKIQSLVGVPPDGQIGNGTRTKINTFWQQNLTNLRNEVTALKSSCVPTKTLQINETRFKNTPEFKNLQAQQETSDWKSEIALLISVLSVLASAYSAYMYALLRQNRTTSQSEQNQNSQGQHSNSQSHQEALITREVQQLKAELQQLRVTVEQKSSYEDRPNNPQPYTREDSVSQFAPSSGSIQQFSQELPEIKPIDLIEAYNSDPGSLSKNAIEVSANEDSINQRRLGGHQKIVLERVNRNKGNYWILPSSRTHFYYLFPKKGIRINEYNYETVAALFLCNNYGSGNIHFQLLKAAKVVTLAQGETWELTEQGELRFF